MIAITTFILSFVLGLRIHNSDIQLLFTVQDTSIFTLPACVLIPLIVRLIILFKLCHPFNIAGEHTFIDFCDFRANNRLLKYKMIQSFELS